MDEKPGDKEPRPPKFPRRRWLPGQVERAEEPAQGGGYDRDRQKDEAHEEIEDTLPEQQDNKDEQEMPSDK